MGRRLSAVCIYGAGAPLTIILWALINGSAPKEPVQNQLGTSTFVLRKRLVVL
jgi:hypothetical protein